MEMAPPMGVHVVVMPFPAAGHSTPFIIFAKWLAKLGVAISFIAPQITLSHFEKDESFEANCNINLVPFELSVDEGVDTVKLDTLKYWMRDNVDMFSDIVGRLMTESLTVDYPSTVDSGPPLCIISDMFLGFTQDIADRYKIPRYCLFASPVHFLSVLYHLRQSNAEGRIPIKREDNPFLIPNFPPIPPCDLPPSQHADNKTPNAHQFLHEESIFMWKSAGVLVNSVCELEVSAIDGLCQYLNDALPNQVPSILTIGPLLDGLGEGDTLFRERICAKPQSGDSFKWLNNQPNYSVLYVCFGSIATLSNTQIYELAVGLERSGHRFFWVLRTPDPEGSDLSDFLPEGFLERTKSRGIVYVEWAPQVQILAHPAIGGFLTHCGWNSALEAMCMGVPMVAMPIQAEQMMNATLIDKILGNGLRINEKGGWVETVRREPIEKAIRTLMDDTTGDEMRRKAMQVSDTMERTTRPGGSSHRNLALFVQQLKSLKAELLVK